MLKQFVLLASGSRSRCNSSYQVQVWRLAAAEHWLSTYTALFSLCFSLSKAAVSAGLTVVTISALSVDKEWSPDFHG